MRQSPTLLFLNLRTFSKSVPWLFQKKILLTLASLCLVCISFSLCKSQKVYPQADFRSPVDYPISLASNFGELRDNHFHAGIDIKTGGVIGKNIYAIESGYVSRVKVSPRGYGTAVYITHPNGLVSVYAHLNKLSDDITTFVEKVQYKKENFEVDVYPGSKQLRVKKGDIIGKSGNSGSSGGPHLHFEIRDEKTEHAINPQLFNFLITDNIPPTVSHLYIYPIRNSSHVGSGTKRKDVLVTGQNGKFGIATEIVVGGDIGFGVDVVDYLNGSSNQCGIYSLELFIDSMRIYYMVLDDLDFFKSRYINSHMDYRECQQNKKYFHRTFIEPNNHLCNYPEQINRGISNFSDTLIHNVRMVMKDVSGNGSVLAFKVKSSPRKSKTEPTTTKKTLMMPFDQVNYFENELVRCTIPKFALYDTLDFFYSNEGRMQGSFTEFHAICNRFIPLHFPMYLSIRTDSVPVEFHSRVTMVQVKNGKLHAHHGSYANGFVSCYVNNFGSYAVFLDTIVPTVKPSGIYDGANLSASKSISFKISDNLSGISTYNGYIDNRWVLFEYDTKSDLVTHYFNKKSKTGKSHIFRLEISDEVGNLTTYLCKFIY